MRWGRGERQRARAPSLPALGAKHVVCSPSMVAKRRKLEPERKPWMFSAVEVGDSAALGGDVRLEVHPRVTVLVGRNGAGKSALMEKIRAGMLGTVDTELTDPFRFACEIHRRETAEPKARYE